MIRRSIKAAIALSLLAASSLVAARPAVIITGEPAGKNVVLGLDFVADSQPVTAVMVEIKLAEGTQKAQLGLDKCTAGLAKTHTGGCNLKANGNLAFLVYGAGDNAALASGPIGTVTVPKAALVMEGGKVVTPFVEFTLPNAQTVQGDAMSEVSMGSGRNTYAK